MAPQSPALQRHPQVRAGHPHRLGDLAVGRARAAPPGRRRPRTPASASAGTARPGCRGRRRRGRGRRPPRGSPAARTPSSDSPASTNPASTVNRPIGQTGWRASSTRAESPEPPSCTRQMTAGSVRGYSSCPAASQMPVPARRGDARRRAVAGAVARGVVPVQDGDRGDEQARAHPVEDGAGHAQVGPVGRVVPGEHVGLAAHRPVRHPVLLAEQHRALGRGGAFGGAGAQPGAAAAVPASRVADLEPGARRVGPFDGRAALVVDHHQPRRRPARLLPGQVGAQRLVAEHLRAGEHRGCRRAGTSCHAAQRPQRRADHARVADDHAGDRRRARRSAAPRPRPPPTVTAASRAG